MFVVTYKLRDLIAFKKSEKKMKTLKKKDLVIPTSLNINLIMTVNVIATQLKARTEETLKLIATVSNAAELTSTKLMTLIKILRTEFLIQLKKPLVIFLVTLSTDVSHPA